MLRVLAFTVFLVGALGASIDVKDDRIIGGVSIGIEKAPYQLAMFSSFGVIWWSFQCGAAIISPTVALSAAHCTSGSLARSLYLLSGTSNRNSGGTRHNLDRLLNHHQYNSRTVANDISLMFMSNAVSFDEAARPVALPSVGHYPQAGTIAVVSGWGSVVAGGLTQANLRAANVPIVALNLCQALYSNFRIQVSEDMLCAGFVDTGNVDACQGYSGGPLVTQGLLVGIVSWGNGCALPAFPGVYANVGHFREWITANAGV